MSRPASRALETPRYSLCKSAAVLKSLFSRFAATMKLHQRSCVFRGSVLVYSALVYRHLVWLRQSIRPSESFETEKIDIFMWKFSGLLKHSLRSE